MKSKGVYVTVGILAVGAAVGAAFLATPKRAPEPVASAEEVQEAASAERRAAHVEKLQRKLRTVRDEQAPTAAASARKEAVKDSSQLVMVDVTEIEDSEWVQSMYDSAYQYQGPTSKEDLEKVHQAKIGVHTEASIREKEDALIDAVPGMKAEIEAARMQREAEQKRFEKTGESTEAKAARDGVQLEQ